MEKKKKTQVSPSSTRPSKKSPSRRGSGRSAAGAGEVRDRKKKREDPRAIRDGGDSGYRVEGNGAIIVGLGASAGGLEAFQRFFAVLPEDSRFSFVVIQHMDPRGGILPELIRKKARIPVVEAQDGTPVDPGKIYVIPPRVNPSIESGRLRIDPYPMQQRLHLPIDFFFRSLAREMKGRAIGVIFSGTGSDGSQGARAIKAEGGIVYAQDEDSAKFPGMPQSAVGSGCVDFVLPPERIASELSSLPDHPLADALTKKGEEPPIGPEEDLRKIYAYLRGETGVDFSYYKQATIRRRIMRRMVMHRIDTFRGYERYLRERPEELAGLSRDFMINVTSFFRDPESFEILKEKALPGLLARKDPTAPARIWVPGCSTGEEVYSLAVCFLEAAAVKEIPIMMQIFATDIDMHSLEEARAGIYPESIAQDVSPRRLQRFFTKKEGKYQIHSSIREMCVFARQDLTRDPPFSRMDLVSCRNVLIYMKPELQKKILSVFHYALKADGILFLGSSESGDSVNLFDAVDRKHRIFVRRPGAEGTGLDFGYPRSEEGKGSAARGAGDSPWSPDRLQKEADKILLSKFAPPGVLVSERMEILQFWGKTEPYLAPAAGPASFNVLRMARGGIMGELRRLIGKARKEERPARTDRLRIKVDGKWAPFSLEVIPFRLPGLPEQQFIVMFHEASSGSPSGKETARIARKEEPEAGERFEEIERELAETREYLESTIEEYRIANEELRGANEEIQSSNEELQSTNEELETAKEELQSTNEELTTVNEELSARNEELAETNDDFRNFHSSVNIPIVLVNAELRIRRFTSQAGGLLNLLETDVGRPIGNVNPNVLVGDLEGKTRSVIRSLQAFSEEVPDKEGRWHRLTIRPYRTQDDRIAGAAILFMDIDAIRRAREEAEKAYRDTLAVVETVREPLLVLDKDLRVLATNRSFAEKFRTSPEETVGQLVYRLGNGQWDIPRLRELLEEILPRDSVLTDYEVEHEFPSIGRRRMLLNARRVDGGMIRPEMILLSIEDATAGR